MKMKYLFTALIVLSTVTNAFSQEKKFKIHTVAFYNLENLFDTINDPKTYDEEYTPSNGWTSKNYNKKLDNLARVINEIGTGDNPLNSPVVIGVCEVENRGVLEDLVKHPKLASRGYNIIHFDSPDKRGIDVGLLYQGKYFTPTSYTNVPLYIYEDNSKNGKENKRRI